MNKVVITGCSGFVGSHLVERLLKDGYHVAGMDTKIFKIKHKGSFTFWQTDICNSNIKHFLLDAKYIFHLAAYVEANKSLEQQAECIRTNIYGTANILQNMGKDCTMILASSAAAKFCANPYGVSKLASEKLNALRENFVNLRFENIYGPRQNPKYAAVIESFVKQAKRNRTLTIYGDGKQSRDFIWIDDIVEILIDAMRYASGTYSIGTTKATTVQELANLVKLLIGSKSSIIYTEAKEGDVQSSVADHSLCKTKLEDGLGKYIEYIKTQK